MRKDSPHTLADTAALPDALRLELQRALLTVPLTQVQRFYEGLPSSGKAHLMQFIARYPSLEKACGHCEKTLFLGQFASKSPERGVVQSRCRDCSKVFSRKHYEANKEEVIANSRVRNKERIEHNKALVKSILAKSQCQCCGSQSKLMFHTSGLTRATPVHQAVYGGLSEDSLMQSINQARVVCKSCYGQEQAQVMHQANQVYLGQNTPKESKVDSLVPKQVWRTYQSSRKPQGEMSQKNKVLIETHLEKKNGYLLVAHDPKTCEVVRNQVFGENFQFEQGNQVLSIAKTQVERAAKESSVLGNPRQSL